MVKNIEGVPVLILWVIYLADPQLDNWPEYCRRSGMATQHAPELFLVSKNLFQLVETVKNTEMVPVFI